MAKDYFGELEKDGDVVSAFVSIRNRNYEGEKFGKWLVVKKKKDCLYFCRCDCGFESVKHISLLLRLSSRQCKRCYRASLDFLYFQGAM